MHKDANLEGYHWLNASVSTTTSISHGTIRGTQRLTRCVLLVSDVRRLRLLLLALGSSLPPASRHAPEVQPQRQLGHRPGQGLLLLMLRCHPAGQGNHAPRERARREGWCTIWLHHATRHVVSVQGSSGTTADAPIHGGAHQAGLKQPDRSTFGELSWIPV